MPDEFTDGEILKLAHVMRRCFGLRAALEVQTIVDKLTHLGHARAAEAWAKVVDKIRNLEEGARVPLH